MNLWCWACSCASRQWLLVGSAFTSDGLTVGFMSVDSFWILFDLVWFVRCAGVYQCHLCSAAVGGTILNTSSHMNCTMHGAWLRMAVQWTRRVQHNECLH